MNEILMSLGGIKFSINTASFEKLRTKTNYRWPLLERLGRRPAHQWIGIGEDTKSFEGCVFPTFDPKNDGSVVGIKQIEKMRSVAEVGIPLQLIDGMGNNYGMWVILSVENDDSVHMPNGAPQKMEFDLQISRYGEDKNGERGIVWAGGDFNTPSAAFGDGLSGNAAVAVV